MKTVKITTSQNIDIDYQVASLSERIAARAIDYFIFICIYSLFTILFVAASTGDNIQDLGAGVHTSSPFDQGEFLILVAVWLGVCVFYDLLTEVFMNGQSLGKRSVKIRVISLSGTRPSISQYLIRWIFRIIDFGISLGTAAVVTVAFSDNKQRIGDMVAGTTVVKTSPMNKFDDLVFGPGADDYQPVYNQVVQLTDRDIVLIYDVIKIFNRTRNNMLVYKLAMRIKAFLSISYGKEINEYQFLEIVLKDYNYLIGNNQV
jgi:uncharacterized RDD family membrane protein YckC